MQALQSSTQLTEGTWDSHIHALLSSLFFQRQPLVTPHSDKDPIQMSLILLNMDPETGNCNFATPDVIGGRMSGLLHVMRLVAVRHIYLLASQHPDLQDAEFE